MRLSSSMWFRAGFVGLFATLFLASCVVVEEERPRPGPPPIDRPQACTFEYAPVCGERRGDRQTFGNPCLARADGYNIVSQGECRRGGGGQPGPQACTREYAPVCGERGGQRQTFGNECVARSEGFRVAHPGECRRESGNRPGRPGPDRESRACTREYAPVCGRRGGQERTFGNSCEAEQASFRVVANRPCR